MTIEDIKELIKNDETRYIELKKSTGELKDAMHSVCAMLNSGGGVVIIGITPGSITNLTSQVKKLIISIGNQNLTRKQVMLQVKLASSSNLMESYLKPAIEQGYVTMLYPDKPRHPQQKYMLTEKGLSVLNIITNK